MCTTPTLEKDYVVCITGMYCWLGVERIVA